MTNETSNNKKPALIAYQVREAETGKSYWNRVGAAWNNKDGGFTVQLTSLPLDGRVVCSPPRTDQN